MGHPLHSERPPRKAAVQTASTANGGVVSHLPTSDREAQLTIADYAKGLAENARDHGLAVAEWNDREWFDLVLDHLQGLEPGEETSGDDVRARFGTSPAMGSAFRTACRRGWIAPIGHRTSTAPSRHKGEQRIWTRT